METEETTHKRRAPSAELDHSPSKHDSEQPRNRGENETRSETVESSPKHQLDKEDIVDRSDAEEDNKSITQSVDMDTSD